MFVFVIILKIHLNKTVYDLLGSTETVGKSSRLRGMSEALS